jgi:hypothetical protein
MTELNGVSIGLRTLLFPGPSVIPPFFEWCNRLTWLGLYRELYAEKLIQLLIRCACSDVALRSFCG